MGRVFHVRCHHHPTLHIEHPNCAHMGTIWVFIVFVMPPSHPSSRRRPKHANGGMFGSSPSTICTPSSPSSHEHAKRVLRDVFFMFDATTTPPFTLNTQNMPMWACFGCSLPPFPPQHLKHDPKSRFRCWLATHCRSSLPFCPSMKNAMSLSRFSCCLGSCSPSLPLLNTQNTPPRHVLRAWCLPCLLSCRQLEKCDGCVALFVLAGYPLLQQTLT